MTTRAEEIAGDGPYTVKEVRPGPFPVLTVVGPTDLTDVYFPRTPQNVRDMLNAAYKQGQHDRWISVKDRLPEKREKDYRVLAMSHKRYPTDCNYPNELKPGVYQDWVIRQWPDNFIWWSEVSFDVLPSPPNPEQR